MSTTKRAADESVRLYPTGDAYIPGEPAIERDVSPAEAKKLLAWEPAAYTTTKPRKSTTEEPAEEPESKAEAPTATEPEPQE